MSELQGFVAKMLTDFDNRRPRSNQIEIGPSSVGGCHRRLWHELAGTKPTNEGDKLAAILGTFIHAGIESSVRASDPWGEQFELEVEVEAGGLKGHVDCYDKINQRVIDWKTIKKGSSRYFGKTNRQQIWQIHLYGWLLTQNGYTVKEVALAGIPRDGKMSDILIHIEPYNPEIAEEALFHLNAVKELVAEGTKPFPEKPVPFCADYCPFYDPSGEIGCPSTVK